MAWKSVVDYMTATKQDSSFQNRAKLAQQYGIKGYQGTANQNVQLLGYLQQPKPAPKPAPKPVVTTKPMVAPKPVVAAPKPVVESAAVKEQRLRDYSIRALQGDVNSQNWLKNNKLTPLTGANLWKGVNVTQSMFNSSNPLRQQYMKDNPLADYTKQYDMGHYGSYNDMITNNKPMTQQQIDWYNNTTQKWNLEDMNDPFVQQRAQLEKDKQGALSAQDVALNQGLGAQDATNFQQFQQLQQMMAERGMADSGIAADTYMRAQMGANQNYQEAFANSALAKSDINSKFNDTIANSKFGQQEREDARADELAQQAIAQEKNNIDLLKQQTEQDKYLTTSTGFVYFNGKQLTNNGKPVTSIEYMKLSETQRHNIATENNIATKNAQDYSLGTDKNAINLQIGMDKNAKTYEVGMDKNAVARSKIAADLQQSIAKNQLEYSKLDYNYAKLEANNKIAQDKIKIAADNAQTSKDKNQLNALGKQANDLAKQITAAQKAGKKPSKAVVDKYNETNNAISKLVGGASFNFTSGGSGGLGSLSKKYESGSGGAGTIANNKGDIGGKSYGIYQIATKTGTMNSFMTFLKGADKVVHTALAGKAIGSAAFDAAWKSLAKTSASKFSDLQHAFIKKSHYDPAASKMSSSVGINPNQRSKALQDVVWSIGVQHGSGGANKIFKAAGINNKMSDETIIKKLYAERSKVDKYFSSSSSSIKRGVANRFKNELNDALAMLKKLF